MRYLKSAPKTPTEQTPELASFMPITLQGDGNVREKSKIEEGRKDEGQKT